MRGGVAVRGGRERDLPAIVEIEAAAFQRPWCSDTFADILRRPEADLLVAAEGDAVVGYAVLVRTTGEAELANLAVSPMHRKQGVGEALLTHAAGTLVELGVRHLYLAVRASNVGAISLYERFGFRGIGVHRSYYRDPAEDARVLALDLSRSGESAD